MPSPPVDAALFRQAMGRFATGVTVLTAHAQGRDAGMTVNAFLSVSLEPPSVLVSLSRDADTTPLVEASRRFAVSVLGFDQRPLSDRFAARIPSAEKFQGVAVHRGADGLPRVDGHVMALECDVLERHPFGTHLLFLGRVTRVEIGRNVEPLVFYGSQYAQRLGAGTLKLGEPPRAGSGPRLA